MRHLTKLFLLTAAFSLFSELFAQTDSTFKIATFNVRMDTEEDSLSAWPYRKEFVKSLIQYHDFDIVGTQEGFFHQIKGILEIPGMSYVGVGRDDGKFAGEHSAIVYKNTRFKLLDSGNFWLRENPNLPGKGWDAICCNRITTWAKFLDNKTKKSFFVFNVHFDHQGITARRESSKLIISKINEIANGCSVILTGDFNSTPEDEPIKILKSEFKDSYDITELPAYGPVGTFNNFELTSSLQKRIDYIFIKGNIRVLKYGVLTDSKNKRYPSDHMPVMAQVEIK